MEYQKDFLREYIENSELRVFNEFIKVRLSKELAKKYDEGCYEEYLKREYEYLKEINTLDIKYPSGAKPILYIYIVPVDNYAKLLRVPKIFDKGRGGGKPVSCYDLEGFNYAYGISQNLVENVPKEPSIALIENEIHELSHIIHSQFFSNNQMLGEGFAEALPLYGLNYEEKYDEHRKALINLKDSEILSAKEILKSERDGTYGKEELIPDRSCSFRLSYISSYLFVRGCMEILVDKYKITRKVAIQKFLEIVKESNCSGEWLILDIANALEIEEDKLLNGIDIQKKVLENLRNI